MDRIKTLEDLERFVEEYGFLPYYGNDKQSLFTLSSLTDNEWHDGSSSDPWLWRMKIAQKGEQAYGKFFRNKTGFASRACIPAFLAVRRENRSFDELYAEGLVSRRAKQVWDCFEFRSTWTFQELKSQSGFAGQRAEFDAALSELQGLFFLCISGQSRRINQKGEPYGWPNNDFTRMDALFPIDADEQMERDEAEAYLKDCVRRIGSFPDKAVQRLLYAGGIR